MNAHLDDGSSIGEMPICVADYQYQASHPSIDAGRDAPPYGQDMIISMRRMTNAEQISEFNSVEHTAYIDRQVDNSKSPNTVGSLEDVVSSMMK